MAFSSTDISVTYQGNGSTSTPYVIPFAFLDTDHIVVTTLNADGVAGGDAVEPPAPPEGQSFTVTRNLDGQGGTVTTSPAVTSASTVTITRTTPIIQPAVFNVNGPFPAKTAETAHDREVMQIQEIESRQAQLEADLAEALERIDALEDGIVITPAAPLNTALPTITGQPVVGSILSCSNGLWADTPSNPTPSGYTYQWTRAGVDIAAATSATYLLVTADIGTASVACKVTATNAAGTTTVAANAVTVTAAPVSSARYYGTSASTSLNEAGIQALTNSPGTNRSLAVTINGGGQYIYYCYPASFGDITSVLLGSSPLNQVGNYLKNPITGINTTVGGVAYVVFRTEYVQAGSDLALTFS